jgi:hypothetical protein
MPRNCSVCLSPERDAIEAHILEKKPYRDLAAQFDLSPSALYRHARVHIQERLIKAKDIAEIGKADDLLRQIEALKARADQILRKAESGGELRTALAGVRELARLIELLGRMTSELKASEMHSSHARYLDAETAERMAKAYLESRNKEIL